MTELQGIRLSPQQRRLWRLQEAHGPLAAEVEAELSGTLDRAALEAAVAAAVARHDILRTTFEAVPGMRVPVQRVAEEGSVLEMHLSPSGPGRHRLRLRLPASCGDLATLRLLLAELAGEAPSDPLQYWQYSEWLNDLLEEEPSSVQAALWRLPAAAEPRLPGEREPDGPWRLLRAVLEIDAAPVRRAAGGASTAAFLLAAWALLLSRHAGAEVPLSVVLDGRELDDLSTVLGPFARALPLRLPLDPPAPFSDLLSRAADGLADLQQRQRFDPGEAAPTPFLFEHRTAPPRLIVAGASLTVLREQALPGPCKLALICTESSDRLTLELLWDASLFGEGGHPGAAGGLLPRLALLLESAAAHPGTPSGDLPVLTAADLQALFEALSPSPAALASPCVPDRIAAQASRTPGAEALAFGRRRLTYGALAARAARLAGRLRALGVGPEVRVGLCADPGPEAIVAILGIWWAGGAWVPVDPRGPAERRIFFLSDSGARAAVASPAAAEALSGFPGEVLVLDLDAPDDPDVPDGPVALPSIRPILPESLAYVLYTSGSTGAPKGVGVEHRQLAAYLAWVESSLFGDAVESCPLLTALTFDACLKQALVPLLRGGTVWGLDTATPDPAALLPALAGRERAGINGTPTFWRAVLDEIEHGGESAPSLAGLARVFLGGERLGPDLLARTAAALPGTEVWNVYGPTEATANAVAGLLDPGAPVVLGRAIDGTRVLLLDERLQPVPPGAAGEICLGGAGVSRGYLQRPGLTAERFVPDPLGAPGERLYRTGDLARWSSGVAGGTPGGLELLGRTDHQVKIRGFRVEPGEIESRLELLPQVREAVVTARGDGPGGLRLVGYVVPERGAAGAIDPGELRAALRAALPDYMVPAEIAVLERLPLLPGGKVDRAALPDAVGTAGGGRPYTAPCTPAERRLAEIWAEVLGRERVGVEDNFFELGGHSIQSIQISHRATAAGLAVTPRDLLQHPTIAELAALVEAPSRTPVPASPLLVPAPERRFEPFPLSEIQQAYLMGRTELFELGGVGPTSYLEAEWPDLDLPRLTAAWRRLLERHDMLRAVVLPDGRWQVLAEVPAWEIGVLDLRGWPQETARQRLTELREEMSRRLFAPERWPLFELRAVLLDGGARLHVARDLLVGDVRSNEILLRELLLLYRDPGAEMPPLQLCLRDYALAVEALHDGEPGRRAREHWRARLADLPPAPDLPLSSTPGRPGFTRRQGGIDPAARERLLGRAGSAGLTLSSVLCAAFAEVLAVWGGSRRFSLNVLYSRRLPLHPQVDALVGNFASTILLEVDGGEPGFEGRAARLQERLWEDLQHGLVSGVEVLREVNRLRGETTRAAMPIVFSSALPFAAPAAAAAEPGPKLLHHSVQTPQVALEVLVAEVDGAVAYTWSAVEEAFPPGFVAAMFDSWQVLLARLAGGGEEAWGAARAPLPAAQLARRREANGTAAPEPAWLLHEPVAQQAAARPDEVAVVAGGRRLTYGELSRAADRLSRELLGPGGEGPGRLVAVVLEKGWEQAVAVLAVLRAGAAYLPVDPGLPLERRWFLLEHGEVETVLTHPGLAGSLGWPRGVRVLAVDGAAEEGGGPPAPARESSDLAYVLFTSGSTGVPKGVMIEHRGAANTVADVNRRFGISASDRALALSSLSFDLSVWDLFGVLAAGGRVVMPDPGASRDPAHWHRLVTREGVTVWSSVPALMELYAEFLEGRGSRFPGSLRLVLLSGDWIPVGLPGRLRALGSRAELISLGGATEASIWSVCRPVGEVDPAWTSIPYGRPMANQTLHVLDEALEPCPDWVSGQLYIGGAGLARGYWKDEEKTRASFLLHPRSGERLYRTGDLGRWLPAGEIELLGREDLQVKIQGYRVEPGEIEAVLARHPAVRSAVVAAVGEAKGHKRLAAYIVPDPRRRGVAPAELRAWLKARLPDYMVPRLFLPLEALPLTANGKVDRGALPAPEPARAAAEAAQERRAAPRTPTEQRMARLWESVLGVSPVGLRDELFELGGDSMLALRLLGAVEKGFGRRLPLAAFFQDATVERLAALVDAPEGGLSAP